MSAKFFSFDSCEREVFAAGLTACLDFISIDMAHGLRCYQTSETRAVRELNPERRRIMEDVSDVNMMFDLLKRPGEISPIERLLNEFEAHESKEEKSLEYYKKILGDMPNPATRFVLQLIISDEEKHRAVIHAMVATLKGSLNWTKPAGSLEAGAGDLSAVNDKLLEATEEFIHIEKEGIKDYKTLIGESSGYYHGLFKVLMDSMIRDSEKHIELLEFLRGSLKTA